MLKKAVIGVAFFNIVIRNLYTKPEHIKGEVTASADYYGLRVDILCSFCAHFFGYPCYLAFDKFGQRNLL